MCDKHRKTAEGIVNGTKELNGQGKRILALIEDSLHQCTPPAEVNRAMKSCGIPLQTRFELTTSYQRQWALQVS